MCYSRNKYYRVEPKNLKKLESWFILSNIARYKTHGQFNIEDVDNNRNKRYSLFNKDIDSIHEYFKVNLESIMHSYEWIYTKDLDSNQDNSNQDDTDQDNSNLQFSVTTKAFPL